MSEDPFFAKCTDHRVGNPNNSRQEGNIADDLFVLMSLLQQHSLANDTYISKGDVPT